MDAHLEESTDGLDDHFGKEVVFVNSGKVETRTGAEALQGLGRIFSNRDYTVYDDLIRPQVKVSEDGTLGWVIVRITARGIRLDESGSPTGPLEFVCAWISTYEKQSGKWKMIGNVSNFEPGRK